MDWTRISYLRPVATAYREEVKVAQRLIATNRSDEYFVSQIRFGFENIQRFVENVIQIETGENVKLTETV